MVSDKKIFYVSPYISLSKVRDPCGVAIFGPRGLIRTNFIEVHQMMLHTKYQGSRPCGFRQEDFFMFPPLKAYVKTCDPQGEAIFGPMVII